MSFDDRLIAFLLGVALGYFLNYVVNLIRSIKRELDDVDEHVRSLDDSKKARRGALLARTVNSIALFAVICLVVLASFLSQKASNDVQDAQKRIELAQDRVKEAQNRVELVVSCTYTVLAQALNALNERSTYTISQSESNVDLQRAQSKMLEILLHAPPYSASRRGEAARAYFDAVVAFLDLSLKAQHKLIENEFPKIEDLELCIGSTT